MRKLALLAPLLLATIVAGAPALTAQRAAAGARFLPPARTAGPRSVVSGSLVSLHDPAAFHRLRRIPNFLDGLSSAFYLGDDSVLGYPGSSQPEIILLQSAPAMANQTQAETAPPADPLIIELQGDRYVRLGTSEKIESTQASLPEPLTTVEDVPAKTKSSAAASQSRNAVKRPANLAATTEASELPPAVLIFRDGRREEVRDYTIADGVIYARGNLYADGYWNKKIEVATLNISETLKSNRARGVEFILPSAPNQIITRP